MKWTFGSLLFLPLLFCQVWLKGQNTPPCTYKLECFDLGLDGWNDAYLEIKTGEKVQRYTLLKGANEIFYFNVVKGDSLTVRFVGGLYDEEIQYDLRSERDSVLFTQRGTMPVPGVVYKNIVSCPSCPAPPGFFVKPTFVGSGKATLTWLPVTNTTSTLLLFKSSPILKPDTFRITKKDTLLTNLNEHTLYTYFLSSICPAGDTSRPAGPFYFETRWKLDVGISGLVAPETDCGLGNDSVKVAIYNYGGEPQSLIPYGYQINLVDVPINRPVDGFYTGVVGPDSTNVTAFDQPFNFSTPGEYHIVAWTQAEKDGEIKNDSISTRIFSIPTISTFPYLTTLEEKFTGWTVDNKSLSSSWALGTPNGANLRDAFSGVNAWGTNLNGNYNAKELSYLNSPCFDFSKLTQDPVLSFRLKLDIEKCCDGVWIEYSKDDGKSWLRLGSPGSGTNWYNDTDRWLWNGNGHAEGWFLAAHALPGVAGNRKIKIRFVFNSDFGTQREGVLLDNIHIAVSNIDLTALSVKNNRKSICENITDLVSLHIGNLGITNTTGLMLAYQVNGGSIITESAATLAVNSGQKSIFTFKQGFDSSKPGLYKIKAWIVGQSVLTHNDTAYFTFKTNTTLPFREDFEAGIFPSDWTGADQIVTKGHNNKSYVVSDMLSANDPRFDVITAPIGPILVKDTLRFDYRAVTLESDGKVGATWNNSDRIEIAISTDCGATFQVIRTINNSMHISSNRYKTIAIDLSAYAGKYVVVRVSALWGSGNYWVDFDNFQSTRCPSSLSLGNTLVRALSSTSGQPAIATITAEAGVGPYTYAWSNGARSRTVELKNPGTYKVTVTDAFGCMDITEIKIGVPTGVQDYLSWMKGISLFPNPTASNPTISFSLVTSDFATIRVFNALGNIIYQAKTASAQSHYHILNLNNQPPGIYWVTVQVSDKQMGLPLVIID
jgi:hypothetical protein